MENNIIFITNLPAFYKINLFNEINKRHKVLAIFTGEKENNRNADFFKGNMDFSAERLNGSSLQQCWQLMKLLYRTKYDRLVISGWDRLTMIIAALISPKSKNGCIVESSIYESSIRGWRALLKKVVLHRMSVVYTPGKMQAELVKALGYRGGDCAMWWLWAA